MDILDNYFVYLRTERRLSESTINSYTCSIKHFRFYLSRHGIELEQAKRVDILGYAESLGNAKALTIKKRIKDIRPFYKFALKRHRTEVLSDPTIGFRLVQKYKNRPAYFQRPEDITDVLNLIQINDKKTFRERLVLELLYSAGIRVSELTHIKIKDVNYSKSLIKILAKGNKERFVYVIPSVMKLLNKFATAYCHRQWYLFPYRQSCMSPKTVRCIVQKYFPAKIYGRVHPHTFRHSLATHLLQSGAPLQAVQIVLGHKCSVSTSRYTHFNKGDNLRKHEMCHPKG